ncbi:MAG TPA: hypothetical protein VFO07_08600, partial [Roseiflexaceae bacterium]|nr:hypothetical protein [Roseiflexaceae bacterium]
MRDRKDFDTPSLAWLPISAIGGALAAVVVAGVLAGRLGVPITGALLLVAALLAALPRLAQLVRGRWAARWAELGAALLALVAVGFAGLAPAWPALLPLGLSVDAVHHYQLVHWIAEHQAFPPLDRGSAGLLGEMNAYPPGFALVAVAAASLMRQAPLAVLYPVVALLGALSAALVVLLSSASGSKLLFENEELRKSHYRSFLNFQFSILNFLGMLVGPLLLLAHQVYTLEAYTNQSYYAMVLGVFLVLLAAGYLIVEPRLTPAGAAQLGLALAALVGVYPLWAAIPALLAGLAIVFAPHAPVQTALEQTKPDRHRLLFLSGGKHRGGRRERMLLFGLALLPPAGLALIDLPLRLRVGQVVLAHQGLVPLPTPQNLVTLLLALPGAAILVVVLLRAVRNPLRAPARTFADQASVRLLALAGIGLAALIGLAAAALAGRAASYHAYKLLFVLVPVGAAIVGAAVLRLSAIARPWARGLALVAAGVLLAATGSFRIAPAPAIQILTPDVVAAAGWLTTNRPRDANKAIVVGAPAGPLSYWLQVGLLGQRRDKAELAMRAFDAPSATPEGWIVDEAMPKFAIAAQLDQPPPGAEVVARFGAAAVLRRSSQFDVAQLDPLLIRYRSAWQGDRLTTDIELLRRRPGRTPLLELRLEQAGQLIASFPLQPDDARARPQYLGLELWPATLGGRGYVNRDAFPEFAPPSNAPSGTFTLLLRLTLDGSTLDERQLATFERTAAGQVQQLPAGGGELVYMRRTQLPNQIEQADARLSDTLRLTGWSEPRRFDDEDALAVGLRWEALRPIDRSLFAEV